MTINWQIANLGWDDSARIDLNVRRREEQRRVYTRAQRKALVILCLTVYGGAVLLPSTMSIFRMRAQAKLLVGKIDETDKQIAQLQSMAGELDAKNAEWKRYQAQQRQRASWGDALATVAAASPNDVYLDHVEIDSKSGSMTITGSCATAQAIDTFVNALQKGGAFQNVTLSDTSTDPLLTRQPVQFKIDAYCTLPLGG